MERRHQTFTAGLKREACVVGPRDMSRGRRSLYQPFEAETHTGVMIMLTCETTIRRNADSLLRVVQSAVKRK